MKITKIELKKEKLLSMPQGEYTFFITLGHITNEINAITRLSYWAANILDFTEEPQHHGRVTTILLLLRILAGKLSESWEFLQKYFFGSVLSRDYEPMLQGEAAEALKGFKRYFGRQNSANLIRNHLAFHYSPDEIAAILPGISGDLFVYLEQEAAPNNLFFFSERLLAEAIVALTNKTNAEDPFNDLIGELFTVSVQFANLADGLMDAIIRKNGVELRASPPEQVELRNLMDFQKIGLPWFTDTTKLVSAINDLKENK